jgi:putative FmdB family regulatory protein
MPLYEFFCRNCEASRDEIWKSSDRPDEQLCGNCGGTSHYVLGKPAMFRVKLDNQGRIGYKYDMGTGKQTYHSATRENYEHNIGNKSLKDLQSMGSDKSKSVYTKEYGKAVAKAEKNKTERLKRILKGEK